MVATQRRIPSWAFLFFFLFAVVLHGQERDLWYAISREGQRFASNRIRVSPVEEGQWKFVTETRIPVNFLGQLQEIHFAGEFVTTLDLQPLSVHCELSTMSGASTIDGTVAGQALTLTTTLDGQQTLEEWPVDPSVPVLFDHCLGEWLASQPPDTSSRKLQLIGLLGDFTMQVSTVTVTSCPTEADPLRWEIESEDPTQSMLLTLGEDGFERERWFEEAGVRVERCSAEEASSIPPLDQTGRDVLTFDLDRPIPNPERLNDLTVEIRWKDLPFEDFELEDARQRLVEGTEKSGSFRAVVNLSSPSPVDDHVSYPVEDDKWSSSLAETAYIKPADPRIRESAEQVVQGHTTAYGAVKALCEWTYQNVEGALIAETLTGPQVLERKIGKCTEYSTLFASLARSMGIPTRIAFGERMFGGQWGGHMWNEAFVGRWIPVDASANEVGSSFQLLKFVHSDTVEGTQPLRRALVESLELSILDFAVDESPLAELYETGIEGAVYTNVDHGCRLSAPNPEWGVIDTGETGDCTIRFSIPEAEHVRIHFVAFGLPPGVPAEAIAVSRFELFRPSYEDFEIVGNESMDVQNAGGHTTCFGGVSKETGVEDRVTEVLWTRGTSGFLLNMIASRVDHDDCLADFEDLLTRFEFLSSSD